MRKNKIYQIAKQMLALVLTLSLVLGFTPAMPATTVQAESTGLQSVPLTSTMAGQTLSPNEIYCVEENVTINGSWNTPGLKVSQTAYIYIAKGCTLTVNGGPASSNTVGGQPGIYLPNGRTLYVTGEGTLKVTGGAGASAGSGTSGGSGQIFHDPDKFRGGDGGNGGRGASGGGAGIGTAGAAGGDGGTGGSGVTYDCNEKDHAGANGGSDGSSGSSSASAGTLRLYGAVKVDASGGSSGSSGSGGSAGGNAQYKWSNTYFAAGGGGGGGGGAAGAASGIGAGGPGGGGGAGGGSGATNYSKNNTYILPGNGGSGGSSGGSSGTTGSSTITGSNYKNGGSGGSGGRQGSKGDDGTVKKDTYVTVSGRSSVGTITVPPYPPQFTYRVTPNNNKGTGSTEPQGASISPNNSEVTLGYPVNCSDGWSVPTRVGYTFAGYNEKADGTGREYVKYLPDAPVGQNFQATGRWNVPKDTTIYAQWSPNPYKVLLNRNNAATPAAITDSDGSGNIENYTTGTTEITAYFDQTMPTGIEIPQRVGYTFLGYYEAPVADDVDDAAIAPSNTQYYDKDGKPTTATWTKPEDGHVLYARWKRTTYTIAYEPNGGTLPEDPEITKTEYTYGDTYDLPSDVNKSEGKQDYIFEGWYLNAEFTTDQIKTIYPANFGNKKYYAKWTPIKGTRADSELLTIPAGTFPYIDPETGDPKPGTTEDYDHTQVYTLINGRPAQVDRVELRSGSGSEMKSYACASDDTGSYGYYSKGSIGKVKIYINGRDTGKTVKSDSNAEIELATAEIQVSKDDAPLIGADVQLRREGEDGKEIIYQLTDKEDGTYSYLWLADQADNEYHVYVNGEDSGKCITLDGGKTLHLSYYTIQVQTKRNDALAEVGPVVIRSGEKEISLTETEQGSGIFETVSVEDITGYRVFVDDEDTKKTVSFTSTGRKAVQDFYDVEIVTRKDQSPFHIGKVELKSGDTVLAVNGAAGNYSVRGQMDALASYDVYVDGADSGMDAKFTSEERRHTIDYYTVTVNVTKDGSPVDEKSEVSLKAFNSSSIPLAWKETGVYTTVRAASDTIYQIWFGSENTKATVQFQPENNTANIDYYGLTLNLRENGVVVSDAMMTLVKDGAIAATFTYDEEAENYQAQIRGEATYDIYRNGADTGVDFVVDAAHKTADVDYYTLSYDVDGAVETPVASDLVRVGEDVTVTSQRLTKTGFAFWGWIIEGEDPAQIYQAKDILTMPDHAVTLKAYWVANEECEASWTYESNGSLVTEYGTMDQALEEAANKYGEVTIRIVKDDAGVNVTKNAELKSATKLLINAGQTLILNDDVTITNHGMIKNNGSITGSSNAVIQNEANGVIDQSVDTSAQEETATTGTLGCDVIGSGTIGFGTIGSGATVTGARLWGEITNNGKVVNPSELDSNEGTFTNDGTLTIEEGKSLTVSGKLTNQGTLTNNGKLELSEETTLTNETGAQFTNNGTLTAKANGSKAAHIDNAGTITNGTGATITLQSAGGQSASMSNTGTISNAGVISLTMAATLNTTSGTVNNTDNGYVLAYRSVPENSTITDTIDGEEVTFKPQVIGIEKVTGSHQVVYVYVTTEEQLLESASVHLDGIQLGADIELTRDLTLSEGASLWIPEGTLLKVSVATTVTVAENSNGLELDGTIWMQSKETDNKLQIADGKLEIGDTGRIYYQFSATISATEKVLGINETFDLRASTDAGKNGTVSYQWYKVVAGSDPESLDGETANTLTFTWDPDMESEKYFCRITWQDEARGILMTADTPECTVSVKMTTDVTLSEESQHVSEVIADQETSKFGEDKANCNADWTATLQAEDGYRLPDSIIVTIAEEEVTQGEEYTYDSATGVITITQDKIRGPIVITVKATPVSYQIRYDVQGAEGAPSLGEKQADGSFLQTVSYDEQLQLADVGTLSSPGAIFKGWATTAGAIDATYQVGTQEAHLQTTEGEVTLYAVWRVKNKIDVTSLTDIITGKDLLEVVSASGLVYTGERQMPQFALAEDARFTITSTSGISVGDYYVELTLTEQAYEYNEWVARDGVIVSNAAVRIPYLITQAQNEFTTVPTCASIVYGSKLEPSAESKFGGVKFRYRRYSEDETVEEKWSYTAPENAGRYQVQAYVTGTANYTGLESALMDVTIAKGVYPKPEKITVVDESIEGKSDGRLVGLTTQMEYRKVGTTSWSAVTAGILADNGPKDLKAGDYEVRYAESDNAEASEILTVTVNKGRKLVATYQAATTGGIMVVATQGAVWGGSVTPSAIEIPERTGYDKIDWSGQCRELYADVTITAKYKSKQIRVTLDKNAADATIPAGSGYIYEVYDQGYYRPYGEALDELLGEMTASAYAVEIPSRTGYTFLGYYTDPEGGVCYIGADGTITPDADNCHFTGADGETAALYAQWQVTAYEYRIVKASDANVKVSGEGAHKSTIAYSDPRIIYIDPTESSFNGDKIYVYVDGQKISEQEMATGSADRITVTVDLEALVTQGKISKPANVMIAIGEEPVSHSISYKYAQGDILAGDITNGMPANTPYVFLEKSGLSSLVTPVRNGYTFEGWYETAGCTSAAVTTIPARTRNDVTLYAKWTRNNYQVTFETTGGVISGTAITGYTYQENQGEDLPQTVSRAGFVFEGWYLSDTFAGNKYTVIPPGAVGDLTFYAKWTDQMCTVTKKETKGVNYVTLSASDTLKYGETYRFKIDINPAYNGESMKVSYYETDVPAVKHFLEPDENGIYTIANIQTDLTIQVEEVKEIPLTPTMKLQKFYQEGTSRDYTAVKLYSFVVWGLQEVTEAHYEWRVAGSDNRWIRLNTEIFSTGVKKADKKRMDFTDTELSGLTPGQEYEVKLVASAGSAPKESDPIVFRMPEQKPDPPTGEITGIIRTEEPGTQISPADENKTFSVSLNEGSTSVVALYQVKNGETFEFTGLPNGEYNLVVLDDETNYQVTKMVTVADGKTTQLGVIVVKAEKQTKVVVKTDAPKVAVDQLNEVYTEIKNVSTTTDASVKALKEATERVESDGGILSLNLIADKATEEKQQDIQEEAKRAITNAAIAMSLDLTAKMVEIYDDGSYTETDIKNTYQKLLIAVPMNEQMQELHKRNIEPQIYREHEGTVEPLRELDNKDADSQEGYYLDWTGGYLYLRANKFSTYAVVYDDPTPPTPTNPSTSGGSGSDPGEPTKPKEPVVSPPQTFDKNDPKDIDITWNDDKEPKQVKLDDKPLDPKDYQPGDKKLTLPKDYLDGLEPGDHTVIIYFDDGTAQKVVITIEEGTEPKPEKPKDEIKDESSLTGNDLSGRKDLGILLTTGKSGKRSIRLTWKKYAGATGYEVYGSLCNGKANYKKVKTTTKLTANNRWLSTKKQYKFFVVAYKKIDGKKVYLAKSPLIHVSLQGSKKTNVSAVKVDRTSVALKRGKTFRLKVELVAEDPKKCLLQHAPLLRYYSSNRKVAVVKNGVITARRTGTCEIYVVANNGVYKKIKVTVK